MDYGKHYARLIERARARVLSGYSERHHIMPRCMGGDNSPGNIVRLTPEEHYVAHQLLVKMYPKHRGLIWAAVCMSNGPQKAERKNKLYGWLRRRFAIYVSETHRGKVVSEESRLKMSLAKLGKKMKPHSAETKAKMSAVAKGKKKSAAHVTALAAAKKGKRLGPHSAEWRANISAGQRRTAHLRDRSSYETPQHRALKAEKMREVWLRRASGEMPMPQRAGG